MAKKITRCWICNNGSVDSDVKVRHRFHVTGRYRDSTHRNCNIKFKLNHKILIAFHKLVDHDSHLIIQKIRFQNKRHNKQIRKIYEL